MKINSKILSIPPYISTSWDNVAGIVMDQRDLIISLKSNVNVSIPNLDKKTLEDIFRAHTDYLEGKGSAADAGDILGNLQGALQMGPLPSSPINFDNLGSFTGMMQHDPTQKDAPDLPREILDRVSQVAKALGLDEASFDAPDGEPHCNCPYCQIAKTLHGVMDTEKGEIVSNEEEIVDDSELKFREWDIKQVADKLYEVGNPLDNSEHYQVYLGQPIGCTCGKNNCEHILAVLNS